jgi:site-specific recombinase XerD
MKNKNDSTILKPRALTLEDLPWLRDMGKINNGSIYITRSARGFKLKKPVHVQTKKILALGQAGLAKYIIQSLVAQRPCLIPFVLDNQSLIKMSSYFLRSQSGSAATLFGYTDRMWRYSNRLEKTPDELVADVANGNGSQKKILAHTQALENYLAELQDQGLSPGRTSSYAKTARTFYRTNGVLITLQPMSRRAIYTYRSPALEELITLLGHADLRERVIILLLALGGFREGTLTKLKYSHVKTDLERGMVPLHIHIEIEITKGKYAAYDTFLGAEAVEFLKLYLDDRRKGSPDGKIPPEEITETSPLIRDSKSKTPRPIGEKQLYKVVHNLFFKAGLIAPGSKRYDLRVHSLRKFFKTQLVARGVPESYTEFFMGHRPDKYGYNDVSSVGIEALRKCYASAHMTITPRVASDREVLKKTLATLVRESGLNPDEIIKWESLAEPHRAFVSQEDLETEQIGALAAAFKEAVKSEVLNELSLEPSEIHRWQSGPGGSRTLELRHVKATS